MHSSNPIPVLSVSGVQAPGSGSVDFSVARGEAVALVAPGGAGKRWLLRVAAGLRSPDPGTVRCTAARTAYVFANGGLLGNVSVLDNISLPLRFSGVTASQARSRAMDVLGGLGLEDFAELRPTGLSIDACQLIQLGRAMALHADLLFLEEPFRFLSPGTADEVIAWLRSELARGRVSVVLTTSDVGDAARIGARVVLLNEPAVVGREAASPSGSP
ncbi:MAG: ATP-binding cassette domain-containing protein [Myxococcales bacterium]|nr:ATP-binding cassette domain-containing protein [Myxococcales bacterium]